MFYTSNARTVDVFPLKKKKSSILLELSKKLEVSQEKTR